MATSVFLCTDALPTAISSDTWLPWLYDVTLHLAHYILDFSMSIGSSGRIVIEVEPEAKRQLYAALAREGLTLKDWFLKNAENYLADCNQLPLSFSQVEADVNSHGVTKSTKRPASGAKT